MDSVIVCSRCGFKSHASVSQGALFITDARYPADDNYQSRIKGEAEAQEEKTDRELTQKSAAGGKNTIE